MPTAVVWVCKPLRHGHESAGKIQAHEKRCEFHDGSIGRAIWKNDGSVMEQSVCPKIS